MSEGDTAAEHEDPDILEGEGPLVLHVEFARRFCTIESLTRGSEIVVRGTLHTIGQVAHEASIEEDATNTAYRLDVTEVIRGDVVGGETVIGPPSFVGDRPLVIPEQTEMLTDVEGVFFLLRDVENGVLGFTTPEGAHFLNGDRVRRSDREHPLATRIETMPAAEFLEAVRAAADSPPLATTRVPCTAASAAASESG